MSIHKLTAGSGYDYLTRQVAAQDTTEKGHSSLASYYSAKGEAPGMWVGSGLAGLDGLDAGDEVSAAQMRNLFGAGKHPLAELLRQRAADGGGTERDQENAARLGTPFRVYEHDVSQFRILVAQRVTARNTSLGLPTDAVVPLDERARIRTEVGIELFRKEYGRDPADARELAAAIAKHSRPRTNAVAGYDLTFSPVKSVSTLWAVADRPTAALIDRAHQAAVKDALAFLEDNALFTREGTNGVRQVEVRGLIGAAFTHRDSRAGDPDLHTHVAVANKVQTQVGGRWLAIDGRVMFAATVTASETYNTALERHLTDSLDVRFEARPGTDAHKRPVREIVGVDPALAQSWSSRRAAIEVRRAALTSQFQASHGRPPSPIESIQLAQQATLETREAKHEPRSLDEQRTTWAAQARDVLGGDAAVRAMVARTLHAGRQGPGQRVDAAWVTKTATTIADTLAGRRAHWNRWHVEAEALRRVRGTEVRTADVDTLVGLLVDEVLAHRSVALTHPEDDVALRGGRGAMPEVLRRSDGASVYTVTGSQLFTSPDLLVAEARVVTHAGRHDGARAGAESVDAAMAESAALGVPLNAGQATLVREMATSGARLQLAIAPAGAGKTTAMRALTNAWRHGGGDVVGLAPSAAAAAVLGESTGATTDTMANLLHHLERGDQLPAWAEHIGPRSLVVVDEAGMTDTLSLDKLATFVIDRGASLRLIGDDQQLSAVGAGGVLRDISATHGSLHLTELMRFTDPAEGAASLALREGQPEALGYYLDNDRVSVGDLTTMTDDVLSAWSVDRDAGRDAIMLAPTRELVSELNQRARAHRLGEHPADDVVQLADGTIASVGDTVITRSNDRRLRVSATDWVKNGDRWIITDLAPDGALSVQHARNGLSMRLPADYVAASVELGYATTIHTAQGVTADAGHTLLTGQESRQLVYTAATRGKAANHLYLEVVDDGDEHNVIRPEHIHPLTGTDLLERILSRDESSRSATTTMRDAQDPGVLLGEAAARYVDSLYVGAEQLLGTAAVHNLDTAADTIVPALSQSPAWPTLRAHLLLLSAHGQDPVQQLRHAANVRELDSADDPAAVLGWRLDDTGMRSTHPGPLPWLPGIPEALSDDPQWGPYLAGRAAHVRDLSDQVREAAAASTAPPTWARDGQHRPSNDLVVDVAVWRAATQVPSTDRRPTGAPQLAIAPARWQRRLNSRLAAQHKPALTEWSETLHAVLPAAARDPFTPVLAERLAALTRAGLDAPGMIRHALTQGPLPDDHAGSALWWRLSRHLSPAVAAQTDTDQTISTPWTSQLAERVGAERAQALQTSPWWPALVTAVDHAVARGNNLDSLFTETVDDAHDDVDPCQAMTWRISLLNDPQPAPIDDDVAPDQNAEEEINPFWSDPIDHDPVHAPTATEWVDLLTAPTDDHAPAEHEPVAPDDHLVTVDPLEHDAFVEAVLTLAANARQHAGVLAPTDRQSDAQSAREFDAAHGPVSPTRILELNELAQDYWASQLPSSWAQHYLIERTGVDLTGDRWVMPGYAPAGWTHLVDHLRGLGATDLELTESGLATTARTGRLIDRFRDRLVLPITRTASDGHLEPLGFVGRRHPDLQDRDGGPKYLNTPDTPLFHKGAQLYVVRPDLLTAGATPVRVEGPLDALAVSLAGGGRFVGAAPLGTSLTEEQAAELARAALRNGTAPVVATDADLAGRIAAQRDYWLLTQHGAAPQAASALAGSDPAELLETRGADALQTALIQAQPLSDTLLQERLETLPGTAALRPAVTVLAAAAPQEWNSGAERIAASTGVPVEAVRRALARAAQRWETDRRAIAGEQINDLSAVRDRANADTTPASPTSAAAERGPATAAPPRPAEPGPAPRR